MKGGKWHPRTLNDDHGTGDNMNWKLLKLPASCSVGEAAEKGDLQHAKESFKAEKRYRRTKNGWKLMGSQ
jgi:hypothetical protein